MFVKKLIFGYEELNKLIRIKWNLFLRKQKYM